MCMSLAHRRHYDHRYTRMAWRLFAVRGNASPASVIRLKLTKSLRSWLHWITDFLAAWTMEIQAGANSALVTFFLVPIGLCHWIRVATRLFARIFHSARVYDHGLRIHLWLCASWYDFLEVSSKCATR